MDPGEASVRAMFRCDGIESQIERSKLAAPEWQMRVDMHIHDVTERHIVFPSITEAKEAADWAILALGPQMAVR
jgi:hypothetical protein